MMPSPREWHAETIGHKVVEALKKNRFQAEYVSTANEARQRVLELVPGNGSVGLGGSVTIAKLNVIEELNSRGNLILNHSAPGLSPEEKIEVRRKQLTCDCFLTSTNAITSDGKLVNVDGTGNRVAAMIFGPKQVLVVAGINKIVKDVDSALERIEQFTAPINNYRLNLPNPCTKTGVCMDCESGTRICNVTTIMRKKPSVTNITVLIVGEELGV